MKIAHVAVVIRNRDLAAAIKEEEMKPRPWYLLREDGDVLSSSFFLLLLRSPRQTKNTLVKCWARSLSSSPFRNRNKKRHRIDEGECQLS